EHAKREFGILAARQDIRHADLIFEADAATAGFGDRHMGRLLMQAEQADEILERHAQSRGGDGGIADETQIARLETVAEPQAEIRIARIARGFLEQRAKSGEFEAEGRLAHGGRIDAGFTADTVDIAAQPRNMVGDAGCGGSEDARMGVVFPRLHMSAFVEADSLAWKASSGNFP